MQWLVSKNRFAKQAEVLIKPDQVIFKAVPIRCHTCGSRQLRWQIVFLGERVRRDSLTARNDPLTLLPTILLPSSIAQWRHCGDCILFISLRQSDYDRPR